MFTSTITKPLHKTKRYGKVDAPAVSEETLEHYNDYYQQLTEGAESIHTLILGATPELRDIVLHYGHQLTTVDRDPTAITEKTQEMFSQNDPNEHVIITDWLAIDLPADQFDVVLADGALTALDKDDHERLLQLIHKVVKPTGNVLLREGSVLHSRPRYSPTTHIHEYRRGQYNIFDLFFGLRLYNNNFQSIDITTRKTYLNQFQTKIDEYYHNGLLSQREHDELRLLAQELEHTLLHREDLEEIMRAYFFPKEIAHDIGSGHLSPWYFFWLQPNDEIELPEHVPTQRYDYVQKFLASRTDSVDQG